MGHKDDGKPSFGPGHDGWHAVTILGTERRVKAKSAFSAAAQCGSNLTQCDVVPITCPECIYELEHGEVGPLPLSHTCEDK